MDGLLDAGVVAAVCEGDGGGALVEEVQLLAAEIEFEEKDEWRISKMRRCVVADSRSLLARCCQL